MIICKDLKTKRSTAEERKGSKMVTRNAKAERITYDLMNKLAIHRAMLINEQVSAGHPAYYL